MQQLQKDEKMGKIYLRQEILKTRYNQDQIYLRQDFVYAAESDPTVYHLLSYPGKYD